MKQKNTIFALLLITVVALLAYFVLADIANIDQTNLNNAQLISPVARQNISGNLLINITAPWRNDTTSDTPRGNFTNVTIFFYNATDNTRLVTRVLTDNNTAINQTFNLTVSTIGYLTDGIYNISINSTNQTGPNTYVVLVNTTVMKTASDFITVDNTVPNGTILFPAARTNFTLGNNLTFAVNISNRSGTAIHTVIFQISNGTKPFNRTAVELGATGSGYYNLSFVIGAVIDEVNISDGNHTMTVFTNDTAGNVNFTLSVNFTVDTVAPNFVQILNDSINSTQGFGNISKNVPTFSFNATDGVGSPENCTLYIDSFANITNINATNRTLTTQIAGRALADGNHNWSVTCSDSVLQSNITAQTANFTVDTVVPDVTVTSPTDRTNFTNGGNITFVARVQNVSGTAIHVVLFEVSNGTSFNLTGVALNTTAFNVSIVINASAWNLTDGNHTVTVFANDTAGNINRTMNVSFIVDKTAPNVVVVSTAVTNLTGTGTTTNISKNVPTFSFNATDGVGSPQNCTLYIDSIANITNVNATNRSLTSQVAERSLIDGTHNWSFTCSDSVLQSNVSLMQNITVSTSNPTVNLHNVSFRSSNSTPTISFNYTHPLLDTANCTLYNTSDGVRFNGTVLTPLANFTSTKWRINTTLGEGKHQVHVNCTTPALNEGVSTDINITVDQSAPVISSSATSLITTTSAKLEATTSEPATCKYDTIDTNYDAMTKGPMDGDGSTSHSVSVSGLTASTAYSYYVRCKDTVQEGSDNKMGASTSIGFTTSAEGGGGGGGSGGGTSSGATGTFEKGVWQSINAGETATVSLKNGALGFTEVSFAVKDTTYGAWVEVRKVDSLPSTITPFGEKAYRTIRITESNVEKVLQGSPTIKFKVMNTWLSDNHLTKNSIALFRYVDGQWNELSTTVGEDDGTYVHYSAKTPGFSYFVIGEKGAAAPIGQEVGVAPGEAPTVPSAGEQPEAAAPEAPATTAMKQKNVAVWLVPLIVLVVLAALLYVYWKRR